MANSALTLQFDTTELKKLVLIALLIIQFLAQASVSEIIFEERFEGTLVCFLLPLDSKFLFILSLNFLPFGFRETARKAETLITKVRLVVYCSSFKFQYAFASSFFNIRNAIEMEQSLPFSTEFS